MNISIKLILAFLIIVSAISIVFVPKVLKVGAIECSSQFGPCSQTLVDKLESLEGKPIGEANSLISQVLTSEVLVKDFSIQLSLPNNLRVNLLERKPKFALKAGMLDPLALVDEDGYIIGFESQSNLPQLTTPSSPGNVGDKVSDENLFALNILSDLFSFYQVREGIVDGGNLQVELQGETKVIFPLEGEKDVLISSLTLVLKKYEDQGKHPKEVDLRYKNPVIRE